MNFTKQKIDGVIIDDQHCGLCRVNASKKQMRPHIRQHFCNHFCHCGYQHYNRDVVVEHQKQNPYQDHARDVCKIYRTGEEQFKAFLEQQRWPADTPSEPLLPSSSAESGPSHGFLLRPKIKHNCNLRNMTNLCELPSKETISWSTYNHPRPNFPFHATF